MSLYSGLRSGFYFFLDKAMINNAIRMLHQNNLLIVTYHSVIPASKRFKEFDYRNCVSAETFDSLISLLKKDYDIITMAKAEVNLAQNRLDGRQAVITFDDGFRNNFLYAFPILQKHHVPAAFYLTTSFIGKRELLWTEKINHLIMGSRLQQLELILDKPCRFDLTDEKAKRSASIQIRTFLKNSDRSKKEEVLDQLMQYFSGDHDIIEHDADRYEFLSWDEVRIMQQAGMEIGSHTHRHNTLNMLSEEDSFSELRDSKAAIEKEVGIACNLFSYPNGESGNYKSVHIEQLQALGYTSAVTQIRGFNNSKTPRHELRRINITSQMDLSVFKAYIAGSFKLFKF